MFGAVIGALVFAAAGWSQIVGASELLDGASGADRRWSGIGRFQNGLSCTAFLIRPPGASGASSALALTNGHCISTGTNEVIRDRALPNTSRVTFRYFRDTVSEQLPVRAIRVLHSTMKGLDLALIELDSTLGQLVNAGIEPLELTTSPPDPGEPVWSVGVPVTGVPLDEQFLRRSACTLGAAADLIEFTWHFWSSYANDCADILGGSSGSPVVSQRTGRVVAVINTTTAGAAIDTGDFRCFNGQPCEVVPGGFLYRRDTNYAVPVADLPRCFGVNGAFDLRLDGCPLDPGVQLAVTFPARAGKPGSAWNAALSGDLAYYRYKVVAEGAGDCRDERGYGEPKELAAANRITDPIPAATGRYYLCVLAGPTPRPDASWQQARFATMIHFRVDDTPATIPVEYLFNDFGDSYMTQPIFVVPELSGYRYKIAMSEADRCESPSNYRTYLRVPLRIPKRDAVHHICYVGEDDAGNETPPLELRLQGAQILPRGVRNAASLRAGPLAPGSLGTVFGVNLDLLDLRLTDAAGRVLTPEILYRSEGQINFRVPEEAATGEASINGLAQLTIATASPGIFNAGLDQIVQRSFTLYVTGAGTDAEAAVSGIVVPTRVVATFAPGVTQIEVALPESFRLRGFLPVTVSSAGVVSAPVTMRFR